MSKVKSQRKAYTLITEIYVFLMLTVFLFYAAGGYTVIQDAKFGAFCIVCGGYVGVMLLLAVEGLLVGTGGFVSPKELLRRSSWPSALRLYTLLSHGSRLCFRTISRRLFWANRGARARLRLRFTS